MTPKWPLHSVIGPAPRRESRGLLFRLKDSHVNVTIEDVAPCRKALRVDVEASAVDRMFQTVTDQFHRQVKLPGFRPGKAPRGIIEKNFGRDVEKEALRKLVNDAYTQALKEHKLQVLRPPEVETLQFGRGQEFQVKFTVETAPEFELPEYKGLAVKKEVRVVNDRDMERGLNVLREKLADYKDVERPAQEGDFVVVNYTGTCEGKPLIELAPTARGLTHQEGFWLEIKPGSFIPGFTEQLAGASKGETRTVTVDFPQDFVAPQLAGKKGEYQVEVTQVKEKTLPELNDEFASKWGAESLEKLQEGIRNDLENEYKSTQRRKLRNDLVEALSRKVQCELPPSLLEQQTRGVIQDIVTENHRRGISKEEIDEKKDEIFQFASANAREKLKVTFLLGRVAEKESIKVTEHDLAAQVMAIAQQQGVSPDALAKDLKKSGGLDQLHERILLSKAIDFLEQHAAIEEVPAPETPA